MPLLPQLTPTCCSGVITKQLYIECIAVLDIEGSSKAIALTGQCSDKYSRASGRPIAEH